ncbi:MAG: hypothetical protein NTY09_02850, partial [bacterium]|nr:hypothetical protein [bacterium]
LGVDIDPAGVVELTGTRPLTSPSKEAIALRVEDLLFFKKRKIRCPRKCIETGDTLFLPETILTYAKLSPGKKRCPRK